MKITSQMAIVFSVALAGEVISDVIPVALPGSVLGMVIMYALLCFKVIKVEKIGKVSDFLVMNMAILFIPLAVGIVEVYPLVREQVWGVGIMCVVTTIMTFLATLGSAMLVMRYQNRSGGGSRDKEGNHVG